MAANPSLIFAKNGFRFMTGCSKLKRIGPLRITHFCKHTGMVSSISTVSSPICGKSSKNQEHGGPCSDHCCEDPFCDEPKSYMSKYCEYHDPLVISYNQFLKHIEVDK